MILTFNLDRYCERESDLITSGKFIETELLNLSDLVIVVRSTPADLVTFRKWYINWLVITMSQRYLVSSGRVDMVVDFKRVVSQRCEFESCQELWILSRKETIHVTYVTPMVLLRCPLTFTVLVGKNIWAVSWQNQNNGFATSMDPDQPAHPRSLIRIHAVRYQFLYLYML
jgi:hypothetical protein